MTTIKHVKSTSIHSYSYDPAAKTLMVRYHSGAYHYAGVPQDVVDKLEEAESIGAFVGGNIRGKYECSKVPEKQETSADAHQHRVF